MRWTARPPPAPPPPRAPPSAGSFPQPGSNPARGRAAEGAGAREQAAKEAAAREAKAREDYLKSLMAQAGTAGGASSGSGVRASGGGGGTGDADWQAKIGASVRRNTTYQVTDDVQGNPIASFRLQIGQDCEIASLRLVKSSGVPAWDEAAERGIRRSSPFPRKKDNTCAEDLTINRGPRDPAR